MRSAFALRIFNEKIIFICSFETIFSREGFCRQQKNGSAEAEP